MSREHARHRLVPALLLAAATAACGDSSGPEASLPAEIVAEWVAEPACAPCGFTVTSTTNPADSLNVVHFLGLTVELSIGARGSFRLRHGSSTSTGTARALSPGTIVVTNSAGVADTIDYGRRGELLDIRLRRIWSLDITGDGTPERVRATGTFRAR